MKNIQPEVYKAMWDNSLVWVDQETLDTTSIFVRASDLDHGFTMVVTFEDWWGDSSGRTQEDMQQIW